MNRLLFALPFASAALAAQAATVEIVNLTRSSGLLFGSGLSITNSGRIGTLTSINGQDEFVIITAPNGIVNLTHGQFARVGQGSINERGQAAFQVRDASQADYGEAVLFDGHTFIALTTQSSIVAPAGLLGSCLNNAGQVVFATRDSLLMYEKGVVSDLLAGTTVTNLGNQPPAINARGDVAFNAVENGRRYQYLLSGSVLLNVSSLLSTELTSIRGYSVINDSGEVAFLARTMSAPNITSLLVYDGQRLLNISERLALTRSIQNVAINNRGDLAFIVDGRELWFMDRQGARLVYTYSGQFPSALALNDRREIAFIDNYDVHVARIR